MIREILLGAIALVVFTLAGALYAIVVLSALGRDLKGLTKAIVSLLLGLLCGVIFIVISEIFYDCVVTPYTAFCYVLGAVSTIVLEDETVGATRKKKSRLKPFIIKLKIKLKRKIKPRKMS